MIRAVVRLRQTCKPALGQARIAAAVRRPPSVLEPTIHSVMPERRRVGGGNVRLRDCGRPNGSDVKLQAAFTRERTSGAPLAARKERFCLSDLQAA